MPGRLVTDKPTVAPLANTFKKVRRVTSGVIPMIPFSGSRMATISELPAGIIVPLGLGVKNLELSQCKIATLGGL
jgi:hypothetical protein